MYGLVHLSEQDLDGQILTPRIPKNYLTEHGYEDGQTARVSFAKDIDGALVGLSANLKGKELYVHEPIDPQSLGIQEITTDDVPDAEWTKEVWATNPATLRRVGKIRVGEAVDEPLTYSFGPHSAETYRWNYEHLKEANESMYGLVKLAAKAKKKSEYIQMGYTRDGKRYGVSISKDKEGYYAHTHRARSKSYPTMEDIPTSKLEFVESTG